jgi:polysaccharide deacetylase family protein (PEP-CTERM system associated)
MKHIFTVDVEDWYHAFPASVFKAHTSAHRLEVGMRVLLDLLEEYDVRATFFWLGTCARQYPTLLKEVKNRGHEIGCHGFGHDPIFTVSPQRFQSDITKALSIISDLTGESVKCFRAPNFSIRHDTFWALEILISLGIEYDSSILPLWHWKTGMFGYRDDIHKIETPSGSIMEVPITKRSFAGLDIPVTGGGYFRAYPYILSRSNIRQHERHDKPIVFYIHPWELDREHPRLAGIRFSKIVHYTGLQYVAERLHRLLREFSFGPLEEIAAGAGIAVADKEIGSLGHLITTTTY